MRGPSGEAKVRRAGRRRTGGRTAALAALAMVGALASGAGPEDAAWARARARPASTTPGAVRMTVLRVGQLKNDYVVLLEDVAQTKILPIGIGLREAQAIQLGVSRITPPRPLTHNLLDATIRALGTVLRLEITDIQGTVFIGRLTVKDARGRVHRIDARPSDLIALAVTGRYPIWVAPKVLQKSGVPHPSPARPGPGHGGGTTPNA